MAKKKNQPTRTKLEEINDSLSGFEQKLEKHKKIIYWVVGGLLALALCIWGYSKFIYAPNVEKAKTEIAKADQLLLKQGVTPQDSAQALQIYQKVAKNYSNKVGNRAKLSAGAILYAQGKYADAQKYLEDYSPKGQLVGPVSQLLLGDTYVNQDQWEKAIDAYDKAIKKAEDNKDLAAICLLKKANVLYYKGKCDEAIKIYEEMEAKYTGPGSMSVEIERAKAKQGK
ncbi:MAG: tetratricopeptide repeat protein [Muribaculaceae bacterium]|nr:tetratricopeptide repeat protein [Muribaculaceae bacterium]